MTTLLEVRDLGKTFSRNRRLIGRPAPVQPAVDGVSFTVAQGRSIAVVGESGAGKSTVGRLVLRLIEPDRGSITFDGIDLRRQSAARMRELRRRMQMVFQDPYSCLNPRMTIADSVAEPLVVHELGSAEERTRRAAEMLDRVGLTARFGRRHPAELSGGQLQRVAIARALIVEPDFVVCDEPTAALDVSVQAQVLELLASMQRELGLALLFITHHLALVEVIADDVLVMRSGRVVEQGPVAQVLRDPAETYTRDLLAAVPTPVPRALRG
ncbi:ATP-binding cassette domain-containing protein [Nocardioides sp. L-11A]|uniref:ATP-binding cassette domain-containing protein n=1 Tax=Nocardioides sp. L-11A TaxID=3043848 RepID=UPI00249B930B|nr:ATP-binding cassette domain-containing protein [Nocardioides sp. L-11A]